MLTIVFVLANGIVFNRSNSLMFNSIFDEWKEVKHFKEITDFQESYNVKQFKEIKSLKSLQKAQAYLESKRASTMELFCKYA